MEVREQPKLKSTWVPSKEEEKVLAYVFDRFQAMDLFRQQEGLEALWDKWEKQSLPGEMERSSDLNIENPSKVRSSMTWNNIQTIASIGVDQNLQIQMIPLNKESRSKAVVMSAIYDFTDQKGKGIIERYFLDMASLKFGTGIWKEYYRSDTRKIKEIDKYDPATEKTTWKESTIEDYNDVYGRCIDIRSFFIDENARNMETARDCFERILIPYESLEYYYPPEKYPNVKHVMPGAYFRELSDLKADTNIQMQDEYVEACEYYSKEKDLRLIFLNGVLVTEHDNPNPYKHKQLPYSRKMFFTKDAESFYGIGIAEVLEHHQAAYETVLNVMIDRQKLALNKPMLVSSGEDMVESILKLEPGKLIEVTDINNFKELGILAPDPVAFQMLELIGRESKLLIGADDPLFGVKTGGTATENSIAKDSSLRKMKVSLVLFQEETMHRIVRMRIANIKQFYSDPIRVEKVVGKKPIDKVKSLLLGQEQVTLKPVYRTLPINLEKKQAEMGTESEYEYKKGSILEVTPEDYDGEFEVTLKKVSALPVSKELMRKQYMEKVETASKVPQIAERTDWDKVTEEFYSQWDDDGDEYIASKKSAVEQMADLALEENEKMMEGINIPATQGPTQEHNDRHRALITSEDFDELDTDVQSIITKHYELEVEELRLIQAQQLAQQAQQQQQMQRGVDQQRQDAMMGIKMPQSPGTPPSTAASTVNPTPNQPLPPGAPSL